MESDAGNRGSSPRGQKVAAVKPPCQKTDTKVGRGERYKSWHGLLALKFGWRKNLSTRYLLEVRDCFYLL
jgi:hypothetical protein